MGRQRSSVESAGDPSMRGADLQQPHQVNAEYAQHRFMGPMSAPRGYSLGVISASPDPSASWRGEVSRFSLSSTQLLLHCSLGTSSW